MKKKHPAPPRSPAVPQAEAAPQAEASPAKSSPAAPVQAAPMAEAAPLSLLERGLPVLFPVLLFLAMTVQSAAMSVVLAALALALSVGGRPLANLRARLSWPVVGLLAFLLLNFAAALYSHFDVTAAAEFAKLLASGSLVLLVLVRWPAGHVRALLWSFAGVSAAIALLCVDSAALGGLFRGFASLMSTLGADYSAPLETAAIAAARFNGIYNDANLTGALLGLALPTSLYLLGAAEKRRARFFAALLLGVNATGFLLAMSRGAILSFAAACLVYLLAEAKGRRIVLFLRMLAAALITGGLSLVAMTAAARSALALDALSILCGVLIFLLEESAVRPLGRKLAGHGKIIIAVAAACVAAVCVLGVAALNWTGPYTLTAQDENSNNIAFLRTARLEPGTYTMTGDWDGEEALGVQIWTVSREQALLNANTLLYKGPVTEAVFTVETAGTVRFGLWGPAGTELRTAVLTGGGGETALPLGYKLLPEFVAVRLQDSLLESLSFLQRVQYLRDGWTLFTQAPLLGHGLGSTENLLPSVQPYFYQSLYLHNHLLQIMDETGLLGLLAFLTLMLGALWLLLRGLRGAEQSLAAALLSCLVMMNLHSLMEINFSVRAFQISAFVVLAAVCIAFPRPAAKKCARAAGWLGMAAVWAFTAVVGGLFALHLNTQRQAADFSTASVNELLEASRGFIARDVFVRDDLKLTFVGNAVQVDSSKFNGDLRRYVDDLRETGSYYFCSGLARYYDLPRGDLETLFQDSRTGIAQNASRREAWDNQFAFYRETVLPAVDETQAETFIAGVTATAEYLAAYNADRPQPVTLSAENQAFAEAAELAEKLPAEDGLALLWASSVPAAG